MRSKSAMRPDVILLLDCFWYSNVHYPDTEEAVPLAGQIRHRVELNLFAYTDRNVPVFKTIPAKPNLPSVFTGGGETPGRKEKQPAFPHLLPLMIAVWCRAL
jgi:hypothetical protein